MVVFYPFPFMGERERENKSPVTVESSGHSWMDADLTCPARDGNPESSETTGSAEGKPSLLPGFIVPGIDSRLLSLFGVGL